MTPRQLMGGSQAAAGFLFPPVTVRFVDSPRPKEAARAQRSRIKRALYDAPPATELVFCPKSPVYTPSLIFCLPRISAK